MAASPHTHAGSSSVPTPDLLRRHSSTNLSTRSSLFRRISTLSVVEQGQVEDVHPEDHVAAEEIDEIKRYEDFTTIDWVRDAAREQQRCKAQKQADLGLFEGHLISRGAGLKRRLRQSYDAGQAWIVVTLIGIAIGLIAACLNIVTEWLSDIKLGYCTTAFYLNESFCCWGAEEGSLPAESRFHPPILSPPLRKLTAAFRLCRVASLEFAYSYKLCILYFVLGTLWSPIHNPPLLTFHLTNTRPSSPSLLLDWSSLSPLMLLAQASPRSSALLLALL